MKVLMRRTETWKCESEREAQEIINAAIDEGGELTKKTVELKQKKVKGEVVDECLKVITQVDIVTDFWENGGE